MTISGLGGAQECGCATSLDLAPRRATAMSHLAFLLLITYLTDELGFNKFNGLGSR